MIQNVLPSDLLGLTQIFLNTNNFGVKDFWGWNWWELHEEETAHWVQIPEKLERFYIVKALLIIEQNTEDEIKKISIPYNRDFVLLIESAHALMKTLDDISSNPGDWEFILSESGIKKVPLFRQILQKAKEDQEKEDIESKRAGHISKDKVKEFKDDVVNGFYRASVLRGIFKYFKKYEELLKKIPGDKKDRLGINNLEDKAAFFDEWHVDYGRLGQSYGKTWLQGKILTFFVK